VRDGMITTPYGSYPAKEGMCRELAIPGSAGTAGARRLPRLDTDGIVAAAFDLAG
jgi:hypothetical protein